MDKKLRILMIGAHPDDCEIQTGGIAAKYSILGHLVKFLSVTNGDTGHHILGGAELAHIRKEEMKQACELIGAESQMLDIHNNQLEANIPTREVIINIVREFRPDLVFTHRLNDYHPDHRRTAMLVQDSAYALRIPNVCPLTPYLDYSPIILYMNDDFIKPTVHSPDIVIAIDDVMDIKARMVHCHKSQMYEWIPWMDGKLNEVPQGEDDRLAWLKEHFMKRDEKAADKVRNQLIEKYGKESGNSIRYAEVFEISEYGGRLTEDEIPFYFPF
jgi:N-acetylglucosamine malate deacetylase 1